MKILAKPIYMIAVFSPEEKPIPYKFKMRERETDEDYVVVTIDKIFHSYASKVAGIETVIYSCQSIIAGMERRYELKYTLPTCQWELYKM